MQIFKNLFFIAFTAFLFVQCSSQEKFWQKQNSETYYNIWHTGAAPAGTGANFFLEFNSQDPTLTVDSFLVNNIALDAEIETTENHTLIIGRHFTPPIIPIAVGVEEKESEIPKFYKQDNYSGRVKLTVKGESFWIEIKSFEKREATHLPL